LEQIIGSSQALVARELVLERETGRAAAAVLAQVEFLEVGQAAVQVRVIAQRAELVPEVPIGQGAEQVLAIDRVVMRIRVIDRLEGELQRAPAVAVPVHGHPHDRLALPVKTKSVIAVPHPDQAPLLEAAEDLVAAVAETTREPAAAEAATAWAGAG
jgi:hypothetical protein